MSFDLYESETADRLATMPPVRTPEVGAWDGFMRGAGLTTMRNLARAGRSIDMAGSVLPIAYDAITGGTEAQTKYFTEHDAAWGTAVDFWTAKPNEVGVAGQITGEVLSMLPLVIASPHLAIAATQLGTAEDLVQKGVGAGKAQAVGAVQGAGLGLGVWMPILGTNGWQRVVVGGAGMNVLQGIGTRAASGMILEGTKAAEEFKAFDGHALTLDVLMGAAFGGLVHLSPAARAQGAAAWDRISAWAQGLTPTEKAALVTLRLSQHMNVDSAPGVPARAVDVEAHVNRVRTAMEQLERGERVDVSNIQEPMFEPDRSRWSQAKANAEALEGVAERVAKNEDLVDLRRMEIEAHLEKQRLQEGAAAVRRAAEETLGRVDAEGVPGFLRSAEDLIALRGDQESLAVEPTVRQAIEIAKKPGFERTAPEKILLDSILGGKLRDFLEPRTPTEENTLGAAVAGALKDLKKTEAPAGQPRGAVPPPPRGSSEGKPAGAEATAKTLDPIAREAERMATEQPDRPIRTGTNPDGTPITKTAKQFLEDARLAAADARKDVGLFEAAAQCLLGRN